MEGDTLVLLGTRAAADGSFLLEGTRWATERRGHRGGRVPAVDWAAHARLCAFVAALAAAQVSGAGGPAVLRAVHDVSAGGLAVALAEMAAASGSGCVVGVDAGVEGAELFTELPSRFVVATPEPAALCARAAAEGIPSAVLGRAGGGRLVLGELVDVALAAVVDAEEGNLVRALGEA
jgi:phosphoribosylformylglycinamidine synthase